MSHFLNRAHIECGSYKDRSSFISLFTVTVPEFDIFLEISLMASNSKRPSPSTLRSLSGKCHHNCSCQNCLSMSLLWNTTPRLANLWIRVIHFTRKPQHDVQTLCGVRMSFVKPNRERAESRRKCWKYISKCSNTNLDMSTFTAIEY